MVIRTGREERPEVPPGRVTTNGEGSAESAIVARQGWRRELAWLVVTMVAAMLAAAFVLELWSARIQVPLGGTQGDGIFTMMVVKDVLTSPWFHHNDLLGAPFGQDLLDFPLYSGDNLQFALIKLFALVSHEPGAVTNAYFLLTFPLVAGAAFLSMRAFGVSRGVTAACSVLFATLPYHFLHGEWHLFLSGYFSVPAGAYLCLCVLVGRPLFTRRTGSTRPLTRWLSRTTLATMGCCFVLGSAGVYYAAFTVILLAILAPLAWLVTRESVRLAWSAVAIALIVGVLGLNLAPNIVHRLVDGPNELVAKRFPSESETYSLSIAALVLPVGDHRIKPLARLKDRYTSQTLLSGDPLIALGTTATVGLAIGLVLVLAGGFLGGHWALARAAGLGALVAMLIGTSGGGSALFAYFISPQIRDWGRISIFIAFFGLVVVAVALDRLLARGAARGWPPLVGVLAVGAVAVLGVLDQASTGFVPRYAEAKAEWGNDARFVAAIEQRVPGRGEIFQLPYVSFPEAGSTLGVAGYDPARGYLHSDRLRFSYGAMKGRSADWSGSLADQPVSRILPSVAAAGFEGIWIDRIGYADRAEAIEKQVQAATRERPVVSENGRLAFYDLRSYGRGLRGTTGPGAIAALRRSTLRPVVLRWISGFLEPEALGEEHWRWMGPTGVIELDNAGDRPRDVVLSARVASGAPGELTVRWPDGRTQRARTRPRPFALEQRLRLPPGSSRVELRTDAPISPGRTPGDGRDLRVQFIGPAVEDAGASPSLPDGK